MKYLTRLRAAFLVCALSLCFVAAKCNDPAKADRFIFAVEAAEGLPAAFGVTGDKAQLAADGFSTIAAAAKNFRDGKGTWENVVSTFQAVRSRESWKRLPPDLRARVDAVFDIAERILNSIQPAGTAAVEGGPLPTPDFDHVDEADLKELERLTGRRK